MTEPVPLQLRNDSLRLCVLPWIGGGIASLEWKGRGDAVALMRGWDGAPDPNHLACYPLLPWSNRIAHGGFFHRGREVTLARNRADDAWPIHGSGWQREWTVSHHDDLTLALTLDESVPEAYSYRALLGYRLDGDTLRVRLRVTNTGEFSLPFGLGLHPFFPLHGGVRLSAAAQSVWQNDGVSPLPVRREAVPEAWDFARNRPLPAGGLNHAFDGWTGEAAIEWPALALRLHVESDAGRYVLYVPEGGSFFCFEPVDHPIDAVHLPGGPLAHGMTDLAPGVSLERSFAFRAETWR
ncbi:aldose 1-epimerase [Luteibacter yeojuensis]|uniref:Aldose 1-epimerase n=1 Tax=Luteibacter yeojuensis TaxID=345309 RepID=A0A7X5TNR3_9GAMM|nr:aldose 1-epimerase [Luteibacter yeojuensis]NID14043.1 aldose 1-epimerase [Luteibacter yeojuensis]